MKRIQKSPKTPISKANAIMKGANLSEEPKHIVQNELVFNTIFTDQISAKANETNK